MSLSSRSIRVEESESDEDDSIKEFELDSDEEESKVINWLDEEEDKEETKKIMELKAMKDRESKPIIEIPNNPYFADHRAIYLALIEVEDLNFLQQSVSRKEELMRSLLVERYEPNQIIFEEGSSQMDIYFVIGACEPRCVGEVEVVKKQDDRNEKVLTRLTRGQYFGQKYFLTKRLRQRSATIRVPKDSKSAVDVAKLVPEQFHIWENYRNMLLIKAAPLIQMLPKPELVEIIQKMEVKEYKPGEYIIRQGDSGNEFFIIREGSVKIIDETNRSYPSVLTTLKEGHFFGEMSLVTEEPRVASVVAVEDTICLTLTKASFKSALSASTFASVFTQVLEQRQAVRKQRAISVITESLSANPSFRVNPTGTIVAGTSGIKKLRSTLSSPQNVSNENRRKSTMSDVSNDSFFSPMKTDFEVKVTSKVTMKKLSSGSRLINKYLVLKELGKGSFGEVFLCQDEETGLKYAMKVINRNPSSSGNDDITTSIRREIAVMKRLRHENVVSLHEVIDDPSARKIFLIQEFMEGGPLLPDDEKVDPISEKQCRVYFRDILCGVSYLHAEGIIHRDIKPSNMLLTADGRVKIADFGTAVFTTGPEKVAAGGTPVFMSPELCSPDQESITRVSKLPAIDVFALGATLYCMVVGRPPWMASNVIELAAKIKNIELTFPDESIDPHLKHLLRRMLDKDYRTRIPLEEVIVDDWVTLEGSDPLFAEDDGDDEIFQVTTNEDLNLAENSSNNNDNNNSNCNCSNIITVSQPASRVTSPRYRAVTKDSFSWSLNSSAYNIPSVSASSPKVVNLSNMESSISEKSVSDKFQSESNNQFDSRDMDEFRRHQLLTASASASSSFIATVTNLQPLSATVKNILHQRSHIKKSPHKRALIVIEKTVMKKQLSHRLKDLRVKSNGVTNNDLAISAIQYGKKIFDFIFYDIDTSSAMNFSSYIQLLKTTNFTGRVIVMTDSTDFCLQFKGQGADYVIVKPVQPEHLRQIIYDGRYEKTSGLKINTDNTIFGLEVEDSIVLNYNSITSAAESTASSPINHMKSSSALSLSKISSNLAMKSSHSEYTLPFIHRNPVFDESIDNNNNNYHKFLLSRYPSKSSNGVEVQTAAMNLHRFGSNSSNSSSNSNNIKGLRRLSKDLSLSSTQEEDVTNLSPISQPHHYLSTSTEMERTDSYSTTSLPSTQSFGKPPLSPERVSLSPDRWKPSTSSPQKKIPLSEGYVDSNRSHLEHKGLSQGPITTKSMQGKNGNTLPDKSSIHLPPI